jgi:hypothetical protein
MENFKHSTKTFLGPNEHLLMFIKKSLSVNVLRVIQKVKGVQGILSTPLKIVQWVPQLQGTHTVSARAGLHCERLDMMCYRLVL